MKIISKNELLNLHGICIAVIINSNYLYNGCAWIKKGLWQLEEDFFFVRFFFSSSSAPCGPWQINIMAICARQEPLCNWPLIPQPIHRTATARLAVDTIFTMETSISCNLWGTWLDNLCVFSVPQRFFFVLARISSAINSAPPNKSIYLSILIWNSLFIAKVNCMKKDQQQFIYCEQPKKSFYVRKHWTCDKWQTSNIPLATLHCYSWSKTFTQGNVEMISKEVCGHNLYN